MSNQDETRAPLPRILVIALWVSGIVLSLCALLVVAVGWLRIDTANISSISIGFGELVLGALLVLALAVVVYVPFRLTRLPAKSSAPSATVDEILKNPHVRRTIMRFEIGGVMVGLIAIIFAIWGLYQANHQSRLAELALRDQRISSAWQIISQQGSGSGGKAYALNILANETTEPLIGLDFSCRVEPEMSSVWALTPDRCRVPVQFRGTTLGDDLALELTIAESDFSFADIRGFSVSNAWLESNNFSNISLFDAEFSSTTIWKSDFIGATFRDVTFDYSSLIGANFSAAWLETRFVRSTLDEVSFAYPVHADIVLEDTALYQVDFTGFWFSLGGLQIVGLSNIFDDEVRRPFVHEPDGAFGFLDIGFNVSGAHFCDQAPGTETPRCWDLASQTFLDHAYYWTDQPPIGLDLLPFDAKIRAGCARPREYDEFDEKTDVFFYASTNCFDNGPVQVSELIEMGTIYPSIVDTQANE